MDWKNKIVVVTGADKAAGRAVAQTLTVAGASVQALHSPLSTLQEELDWVGAVNGRIEALFCDATVADPGMTAAQLTPDVIRRYMDDSARYAWKSALYAVPRLRAAENAAVVFITNSSVRHPPHGQCDRRRLLRIGGVHHQEFFVRGRLLRHPHPYRAARRGHDP